MSSVTSILISAVIFVYAIVPAMCNLAPDYETSAEDVMDPFPKRKCESLLVNCSCYDYIEAVGIDCDGVKDYSNFSKFLDSGTIFAVGTKYEITFSGITYLPQRVLEGLTVARLYLDDPNLNTIDERAFDRVRLLTRFHVRHSNIQVAPDFRVIRNSIRSINIDCSNLTSLGGENFQNLPFVTRLSFVNNSISYIDPHAFKGTDAVLVFDISYNRLTFLPPNLLDPWKKLNKFVASHNNLLHVDQLFAVTHPKFIFLEYNNLTNVRSVLHYNMTAVETVALAGNPLEDISIFFFDRIPRVRFLYFDHCQIRDFNERSFRRLDRLATLDLSYNLIEEVSKQSIGFGTKLELDFTGNHIKKFDAEITYSVRQFYINENKLQNLGTMLLRTQIIEVSVARNLIQYLSEEDFRSVHATANLELQGNRIQKIERLTFKSIKNYLNYLDLSSNFIRSLNGSIKSLSRLKLLNLTDNSIQTFENGEFTGLNELSELYLQHNQIIALNGQLQQLPLLQFLVITHNNIETLSPDQLPKDPKYIYVADNPFKCDCRLLPFLLWLNTSGAPKTDVDLCAKLDEGGSNLQRTTQCPMACLCECTKEGNLHFISVNCSSKNLTEVPAFLVDSFVKIQDSSTVTFDFRRSVVLDQNAYPSFHIQDHVLGIDLENNSIESLESAQLPPALIDLYLSDNKLRRLDESMLYTLKNLKRVTLSGNPWDCDCAALGFKKWLLSKTDIIKDINITRCGSDENSESGLDGRAIWTLTDLDICPADIGLYVSVAFGILVFLLMCLATKIMYTKYELNIKVFLYSHGITWVKERDLDYDKKFDAFISFSHKDEAFVSSEIISVIENKNPNIHLCIHYRHFRPGEFIHDNIIHAVQNSKRTVLILSRNFLESEWCLMEFRAAHVQALEDKVHRIIVVKVGDLPKEIDPSIKVYLDSTTYLTWGDKYFWNNLMYVLPASGTERNPVPQNGFVVMKDVTDMENNAH